MEGGTDSAGSGYSPPMFRMRAATGEEAARGGEKEGGGGARYAGLQATTAAAPATAAEFERHGGGESNKAMDSRHATGGGSGASAAVAQETQKTQETKALRAELGGASGHANGDDGGRGGGGAQETEVLRSEHGGAGDDAMDPGPRGGERPLATGGGGGGGGGAAGGQETQATEALHAELAALRKREREILGLLGYDPHVQKVAASRPEEAKRGARTHPPQGEGEGERGGGGQATHPGDATESEQMAVAVVGGEGVGGGETKEEAQVRVVGVGGEGEGEGGGDARARGGGRDAVSRLFIQSGQLTVTVLRGENLRNAQKGKFTLSKQDPYVKMKPTWSSGDEWKETGVCENGGSQPVWKATNPKHDPTRGFGFDRPRYDQLLSGGPFQAELEVRVLNTHSNREDPIGNGVVDLDDLLKDVDPSTDNGALFPAVEVQVPLMHGKDPAGTLFLAVEFEPTTGGRLQRKEVLFIDGQQATEEQVGQQAQATAGDANKEAGGERVPGNEKEEEEAESRERAAEAASPGHEHADAMDLLYGDDAGVAAKTVAFDSESGPRLSSENGYGEEAADGGWGGAPESDENENRIRVLPTSWKRWSRGPPRLLMWALRHPPESSTHAEIVRAMVEREPGLLRNHCRAATAFGTTLLLCASEYGHTPIVRALLEADSSVAHVRMVDNNGRSSIHYAASAGHDQCMELLLAAGTEVSAGRSTKQEPFPVIDANGFAPLHEAAHAGHDRCVELLLAAGAYANAAARDGDTPLHRAAHAGHDRCVHVLLAAGADLNAAATNGGTPLHYAAYAGNDQCIRRLLLAGADVNAASQDGTTPLHRAAGEGNDECVEVLLAAGAEVNATATNGGTPLQKAAHKGCDRTVELLLAAGALRGKRSMWQISRMGFPRTMLSQGAATTNA